MSGKIIFQVPAYSELRLYTAERFLNRINIGIAENKKPYSFALQVSAVIIAPCWDLGIGVPGRALEDYRRLVEMASAGRILFISACCGPYSLQFTRSLKKRFHSTKWLFPKTQDFCGRVKDVELIQDLKRAGIIRQNKN